jgi:hypothetical protein
VVLNNEEEKPAQEKYHELSGMVKGKLDLTNKQSEPWEHLEIEHHLDRNLDY